MGRGASWEKFARDSESLQKKYSLHYKSDSRAYEKKNGTSLTKIKKNGFR